MDRGDKRRTRDGMGRHRRPVRKQPFGLQQLAPLAESPDDRERLASVLHRFGEAAAASPNGVAARLPEGVGDLAEIVRTLDSEGLRIADLRLHAPTLDDVFLAKTGRSLRES